MIFAPTGRLRQLVCGYLILEGSGAAFIRYEGVCQVPVP